MIEKKIKIFSTGLVIAIIILGVCIVYQQIEIQSLKKEIININENIKLNSNIWEQQIKFNKNVQDILDLLIG